MKAARLLVVILLFLPFVYADVQLTSFDSWITTDSSLCACGTFEQTLHIFNTGRENTFTVKVEGLDRNLAGMQVQTIFLERGETKVVPLHFGVPCDEKNLNYVVVVETSDNVRKEFKENYEVNACENTQVTPLVQQVEENPCSPLTFEFRVANNGGFSETYTFSASGIGKEMSFFPPAIALAQGREVTVAGVVKLACDVHGTFPFTITTVAEKSKKEMSFPAQATVRKNYGFSVEAGTWNGQFVKQTSPYALCQGQTLFIPVRINNTGAVTNQYDIEVTRANTNNNQVTLRQGQTATIPIKYEAKNVVRENIVVKVEADRGREKKGVVLPVSVENCYDLAMHVPSEIHVSGTTLPILLENKGTKTLDLSLALEGPEYLSLSKKEATVDNTASVSLLLERTPVEAVEGVTVYAQLPDGTVEEVSTTLVFGNPFWHNNRWYVIGGAVVVMVLAILGIFLWRRPSEDTSLTPETKKAVRNAKEATDRESPKQKSTQE